MLGGAGDTGQGMPGVCMGGGWAEGGAILRTKVSPKDPERPHISCGPQGLCPTPGSSQGSQEKIFFACISPHPSHPAHAGEDGELRDWFRDGFPPVHTSVSSPTDWPQTVACPASQPTSAVSVLSQCWQEVVPTRNVCALQHLPIWIDLGLPGHKSQISAKNTLTSPLSPIKCWRWITIDTEIMWYETLVYPFWENADRQQCQNVWKQFTVNDLCNRIDQLVAQTCMKYSRPHKHKGWWKEAI